MSATGNLYFIQVGEAGPIKIGWTTGAVLVRMRALQSASPHELVWRGALLAPRSREASAHRALAAFRLRGEWFHPVAPVIQYMRNAVGEFDELEYLRAQFRPDLTAKIAGVKATRNDAIFLKIVEAADIDIWRLNKWIARESILEPDELERFEVAVARFERGEFGFPEKSKRKSSGRPYRRQWRIDLDGAAA